MPLINVSRTIVNEEETSWANDFHIIAREQSAKKERKIMNLFGRTKPNAIKTVIFIFKRARHRQRETAKEKEKEKEGERESGELDKNKTNTISTNKTSKEKKIY